ncbi:hypothetical protein BDV37DRAFT_241951 [Aspergillus pseudonomiae]|uniref:Uncharacterized protein n=1 Tax=Aspergillus pseudonomiae TaxID=1506151 RepID=A0A5N7DL02_9EURO|nr:uncharacterized protein BDV37DRAFT_241951 [Aspergillus pseudonomiae]KAE8407120.1 hypothetical protein BDV37DRAFT_241951 [Aspergillus pseudonomiae]
MALLRVKPFHGIIHSHPPWATASFSTRTVLQNQDHTHKKKQPNDRREDYWKYDLSFKTQMGKTVLIAVLAGAGAVESWTWYQEIRAWWTGVRDDGRDV